MSEVSHGVLSVERSRRILPWCRCSVEPRPPKRSCCTRLKDDEIQRPDLAIYSQIEQLSNGQNPTWDSPDITTNAWRPFRLLEEAHVVVRNLSSNASAVNALVNYYIAPFGIGMRRELKSSKRISLGANSQVELLFPLEQAVLSGDPRVGVHVEIEHPHDSKAINNKGAQIHVGDYTTEAGRTHSVSIPVLNDSAFARQISFQILPTNLNASITPTSHNFAPGEQITATLNIEVPGSIVGSSSNVINESVTVMGVAADGTLVGGVTRLLRIDS